MFDILKDAALMYKTTRHMGVKLFHFFDAIKAANWCVCFSEIEDR